MKVDMQNFIIIALLVGATCCAASETDQPGASQNNVNLRQADAAPQLSTKIALVGSKDVLDRISHSNDFIYQTSELLNQAKLESRFEDDIEEDPKDRFITTRSGKPRPSFADGEEVDSWVDEKPIPHRIKPKIDSNQPPASLGVKLLSRKKRCGGGGGDDDDGVNRARRYRNVSRGGRRTRKSASSTETKKAKKTKKTKTVVTKKVIQNGQVISQTSETISGGQPATVVLSNQQPQAPVVQTVAQPVAQPTVIQTVPAQPAAVQTTVPVQQQAPVIVHQQPQQVPSIAVQGSIKIN